MLAKEIAAVEEAAGQPGHFSLAFGFDRYRNRNALDILVVSYSVCSVPATGTASAAVRIEGSTRPDPEPAIRAR